MTTRLPTLAAALLSCALGLHAQDAATDALVPPVGFDAAATKVQARLESAIEELDSVRAEIQSEQVPLNKELRELEAELSKLRGDYQQVTRLVDSRTLDLSNLTNEITSRREEATYLSNLLGEYTRNFESRLHITELQRYEQPLETARLALENSGLSQEEVYAAELALLETSIDRLEDSLGGSRFEGTAVDPQGLVKHGQVVLVGPAALFRSDDGAVVGTAEQRLGSLEPTVVLFGTPETAETAAQLVSAGRGEFPVDPTLGNAHKIEATKETFLEHVQKGGAVMWPILGMAAAALLIALIKWISIAFLRKPSAKQVDALLQAVAARDETAAAERAQRMGGPVGRMLEAGVENLRESRELIEEVMYEKVLTTRLKLDRMLPFIAICAASAPLLGLLGTVTGIINTFKLITVFGSGDVKSLSGGISEALITTKFGLIVAIPSLLLHAFLSRKVRGVVSQMETAAVSFVNTASKAGITADRAAGGDADRGPHGDGSGVPRDATPATPVAPSRVEPDPVGV